MTNKLSKDLVGRGQKYRIDGISMWRIGADIIEVVVDSVVDAGSHHIKQIFNLAHEMQPKPRALLINRENDYSVQFSALMEARNNNPFKLVAMVNNGRGNQFYSKLLWPKFLKLAIFDHREEAIVWLNDRLSRL